MPPETMILLQSYLSYSYNAPDGTSLHSDSKHVVSLLSEKHKQNFDSSEIRLLVTPILLWQLLAEGLCAFVWQDRPAVFKMFRIVYVSAPKLSLCKEQKWIFSSTHTYQSSLNFLLSGLPLHIFGNTQPVWQYRSVSELGWFTKVSLFFDGKFQSHLLRKMFYVLSLYL